MQAPTFARRMVARCVQAARKANHEALRLRAAGDAEGAAVAREFALMNIGEAKNGKGQARASKRWDRTS